MKVNDCSHYNHVRLIGEEYTAWKIAKERTPGDPVDYGKLQGILTDSIEYPIQVTLEANAYARSCS